MQAPLDPSENLPCLTYIRHPVERLVSFYYWVYDRNKLAAPLLQARTSAPGIVAIIVIMPWGRGGLGAVVCTTHGSIRRECIGSKLRGPGLRHAETFL